MRYQRLLFVLSFVLLGSNSARAMTVAELIATYQALNSTLQNTMATAGAEGRSVAGVASDALDGAMRQLQSLVQGDLNRDIQTLSGSALALAQSIQGAVNALNALLNQRVTCALEGTEYLLYGVKTIASQLQNALPLVKDSKPYLYGFAFDGHFWGVVPAQGGRMTVKGFALWNHNKPPAVRLLDSNNNKIADLQPQNAQSTDTVAVQVDSITIQRLAGSCALIEVTPNKAQPMVLPICIPSSLNAQVYFAVNASFERTDTLPDRALNQQVMSCTNDSCEHRGDCNPPSITWPLDTGCTAVRVASSKGSNWWGDGHNVSISLSASGTISAKGTSDTASCVSGPFGIGARRYHSSVWEMVVAPVVSCKVTNWTPATATSASWAFDSDTGPHCVDIPRPTAEASSWASTLWVKYGGGDPVEFGQVPSTSPVIVQQNATITISGAIINVNYTPDAGGNKGQACMTLTVPKCGY